MSGEPKGVRVEDVNAIAGMWHDAEVRSFAFVYDGNWQCDAVLRCVINFEEDRTPLIAIGVTTLGVELRFADVEKAHSTVIYPTGSITTIDRWNAPDSHTHHIECHGGTIYDIRCHEVWLTETDEQ